MSQNPSPISLKGVERPVSRLCLGTGEFGTTIGEDQAFAMLDRMRELGGSFIDTANNYGDWSPTAPRSASEKVIGKWLKLRSDRHEITVATKGGHPKFDAPQVGRLSRAEILSDIEGSRSSLDQPALDLYYLHVDDLTRTVPEIMDALFEAKDRGWVTAIGASNWRVSRLKQAQAYAESQGQTGFVADQTLWNAAVLADRPYGSDTTGWMNQERFDFLAEAGMVSCPYQSQAYGLFQRMAKGELDQMNQGFRGFYVEAEARRRLHVLLQITEERGITLTQAVLGYLLSQPIPVSPIVGCRSLAQLDDSFSALHIQLSEEEVEAIDQRRKGSEIPTS